MTDFRFDPRRMRDRKLRRRKATIQILSRLGFSPVEIARMDGDCTAWDIIEYFRFVERFRSHIEAVAEEREPPSSPYD